MEEVLESGPQPGAPGVSPIPPPQDRQTTPRPAAVRTRAGIWGLAQIKAFPPTPDWSHQRANYPQKVSECSDQGSLRLTRRRRFVSPSTSTLPSHGTDGPVLETQTLSVHREGTRLDWQEGGVRLPKRNRTIVTRPPGPAQMAFPSAPEDSPLST